MAVNSFREDEEQKQVMNRETILRLFRYLLAYKKTVAAVILIMAVTTAITMVNPLLIEHAVDSDIAMGDMRGLMYIGVIALILNLIWLAGVKLRMVMVAGIANQVVLKIREQLYVHLQTLSFHFFDSRPTGKILARVIGDVNSLKEVLSDSVTTLIPDFCTIIGVMAIMMVKNWRLGLAAVITLPFLAGGMYIIQTFSHKRWQLVRKKNSNVNAFVHEKLSGIRIVQSFRSEQESMEDFNILVNDQVAAYTGAVRWADAFGPLIDVTWGIGGFLLYFIGIRIIGVGNVGVGTFLAFSTYLGMFWSPLRNLANFYNKMVTNLSAAERVFEIMDTEPEIKDREGVTDLPDVEGEVAFDHVSFAYEDAPDQMVLNDVSFTARPGETIA